MNESVNLNQKQLKDILVNIHSLGEKNIVINAVDAIREIESEIKLIMEEQK